MATPKKADKAKQRRDRGQTYLKELLARVPDEQRVAAEEALASDEVLAHLGDSVLRQSDYSRVMDTLQADIDKYQELYDDNIRWRQTQETGVSEMQTKLSKAEAALLQDPLLDPGTTTPPPGVDLSDYVTRADAEKSLQERLGETERNGIRLMAMISNIQARHLKDFGEALDAQELFEHATKVSLPLPAAYQDFVKERVEDAREKTHKEEVTQAREEGRLEALRTPMLPHNVSNNEPTVLDVLGMKDRSEFGLTKAVDDYWQMQTKKQAAS